MRNTTLLLAACVALLITRDLQAGSPADRPEQSGPLKTADLTNGQKLFATCAACHQPDGRGTQDGAIPAIAGQSLRMLTDEILDFRYMRRWEARMEHFSATEHLRGLQEVTDVAAYISSLPAQQTRDVGSGLHLATGSLLYGRQCIRCHGERGQGDAKRGYPRLAGQHFQYLLRQMQDSVAGRRSNLSYDHDQLMNRLEPAQIEGIADHLARLTP